MAVSITCIHRESRHVAAETAARGIKAEERNDVCIRIHRTCPGYRGSARIPALRGALDNNLRDKSPICICDSKDVRINSRTPFPEIDGKATSKRRFRERFMGERKTKELSRGLRKKKDEVEQNFGMTH